MSPYGSSSAKRTVYLSERERDILGWVLGSGLILDGLTPSVAAEVARLRAKLGRAP